MSTSQKLSLRDALLINVNVMFGTGVFINTVNLSQKAGFLGFFSYILVGLLMTPLIFSIAAVVQKYPTGGFYQYATHDLSQTAGFLSAWAYFTAKLASASLLIHIFSTIIKVLIPTLTIPTLALDIFILMFFIWLNSYNLKTGTKITYAFIVLKLTPIIFSIVSCLYLINSWTFPESTFLWQGIPETIPLVLYAFVGFEAACSLSNSIIDAKRNAPLAIIYSFGLVLLVTVIYQFVMFAAIGTELMTKHHFLDIFPTLFGHLFHSTSSFAFHIRNLLYIAGASSALGGSYGILLSNSWNLYTLAKNDHVFFSSFFTRLNTFGIPFGCVLVEGFLCLIYFFLTLGHQVTLQQISVLGCTIAYTLSIAGFLKTQLHHFNKTLAVALLGFGSCCFLIAMCVRNFLLLGTYDLWFFVLMLVLGYTMFLLKGLPYFQGQQRQQTQN